MTDNRKSCGQPLGEDATHEQERAHKEKILRNISVAKATGQPVKSLVEWCREAAACNLDYGTYRTLVEVQGKTFAELKAQSQNRHITHHAHGRHTRSVREE